MKMVKALISRGQIDAITASLSSLGISGMTLCEVKCPADENVLYRAVDSPLYESKVMIEIAISDDRVGQLVHILSGRDFDPELAVDKICVLDIQESIRIRTGEKNDSSL